MSDAEFDRHATSYRELHESNISILGEDPADGRARWQAMRKLTSMTVNLRMLPAWLLTTLFLGGVALGAHAVALLTGHVIFTVDFVIHYQWATQFSNVLAEGTWCPRWMPLANHGLGDASFVIGSPQLLRYGSSEDSRA